MWLLNVFGALAVAILGQYLLRRLELMRNPLAAFLLSGTVLGVWLMAVLYHGTTPTVMTTGTLLYALLCELYIFLFTFAYSSVSANLLVRLRGRILQRDVIDHLYESDAMVTQRVRGLIEVGLLTDTDGSIVATPRGKTVATIFATVRRFFGHR